MIKIIKKVSKQDLKKHLYNLNTDDENLYSEANNENSIGIFQLNGNLANEIIKTIKPKNFDEINAVSAFARPGTSSFVEQYIKNRDLGRSPYPDKVAYLLSETNSICLYQEQAMSIFNKIGGFSLEETDQIRGLMKKLGKADKKKADLEKWDKIIERFILGAQENEISPRDAKMVAADLLKMSSYQFNKCFSGDMIIDKDNSSGWVPTIEEMFLTKNNPKWAKDSGHRALHYKYKNYGYISGFSIRENKKLYKNKIKDIYFSGERVVFKITLENEKFIEVTENHSFPVLIDNQIKYKSIEDGLSVGDYLFSNDGYETTIFKGRYNFTEDSNETREFKKTVAFYGDKENNTGFIDGESIKLKNNREKLLSKSNGVCQICNSKTKREECHHIDGDRKNNNIENLIILCPSCHKKEDYKLGRNKKDSKGKLTSLKKIISIENIGIKKTYDVEMEAPYHTVSVNGIIAKNSHSTAYTYIAAQTLYLSYYFRKYFYSSVLHYEVGRDKYLLDRLKSVKSQGFEILPPDVNKSKISLSPLDGNKIIFGLFDIKGIGETPATTIVSLQPFKSFIDFVLNIQGKKITVTVIKALIGIGAFDELYEHDRKRLLETFLIYWKNKKSTKVPEKLQKVWEDAEKEMSGIKIEEASYDDLRDFERKLLGFNFFINPFNEEFLEAVDKLVKRNMAYGCFEEVKRGSAKVPVIVNKIKTLIDKNYKEMAFLDIEDKNGTSISIPVFQSFWKILKDRFVEGKIHMINLYMNEDQIMLGRKGFVRKEVEISRMVKRLDNV